MPWKAQDHDALVAKHDIYAHEILLPLLAHILNRAMSEGFLTRCTEHSTVPILKSGDSMMPSNSRTITIDYYLANLHGPILKSELSIWQREMAVIQLDRQDFETFLKSLRHYAVLGLCNS